MRSHVLSPMDREILTTNGSPLILFGKTIIDIEINGNVCSNIAVIADLNVDGVLGIDFQKSQNCVINITKGNVWVNGRETSLHFEGQIGCYGVYVASILQLPPSSKDLESSTVLPNQEVSIVDTNKGILSRILAKNQGESRLTCYHCNKMFKKAAYYRHHKTRFHQPMMLKSLRKDQKIPKKKPEKVEAPAKEELLELLTYRKYIKNVRRFWLDATDDVVEGYWKWASTEANLTYTDWYPGQPSNGGSTHNEDCVHIYPGLNYRWNDIHCTYEEYFICEDEKKPSKKKSKKKDILSSTNVNKGELYTGDITNANNHTYPLFDNPSLMSNMNNMNQQRFTQDTNLMYSPGPNPMFQLQNQQLCSTPNSGAIYHMQHVQHSSPVMQYTSQQRPVWVNELFQRIDTFENKLNKLDKIDSLVTSLNAKVVKLEVNAKVIDNRLEQVEKSTQLISNNFDKVESFKTELDKVSKQMKSVSGEKNSVDEINASVESMKKENNKLKDELIDIQMKSMQNNLIFYNIKETEEEICSEIIGRFCENNMKIDGAATKVVISDAHRLGKKGEKTRPILVKFSTFESRDLVKKTQKI
ncbi:unnamed protein product [Mytilus coruscus]|uniref:C-type lectin domain-containing protein n=1 Tax=Mytilus coruscus TaxID=42192 RepID=A0A6J8D9D6_MYTCO|nr:unnamed protein product [Mytilus coruscus]